MKKILLRSPFILFFMAAAFTTIETRGNSLPDSIPKGWRFFSENPPGFVIGTDTSVNHSGKTSVFVKRAFALKPSTGSGLLLQSITAGAYRNKRVRMSVYARSTELESGAYFYFQANGRDTILAYANTAANIIAETTDWTLFHITLDVPEAAINLELGAKMTPGQGTIWVDDFNLEIVDQNIPSDDWVAPRKLRMAVAKYKFQSNTKAMNLGFEDR